MEFLASYQKYVIDALTQFNQGRSPQGLYQPIDYILDLGGKRLRPVLVLMACEAFGKKRSEALPAAQAIEVFHNFTLMHDDIMDRSSLRRGAQTVHEKWDLNTAILSGDAMLVQAYTLLNKYEPKLFKSLTALFSKTALEVCEGQQYDVDFESRSDVNLEDYLEMIRLKTAVLVGCAMQMGAWVGGASDEDAQQLYQFGEQLGIAFQLQDDYLDTFGDEASFGKRIGGDIVENKKTILLHLANSTGTDVQRNTLKKWLSETPTDNTQKINAVKKLFKDTAADTATLTHVRQYTERAFEALEKVNINQEMKQRFIEFGNWLMQRTH
jgi:geranylgeranyl diphosphate synthase type II